jgi:hypothetical protein
LTPGKARALFDCPNALWLASPLRVTEMIEIRNDLTKNLDIFSLDVSVKPRLPVSVKTGQFEQSSDVDALLGNTTNIPSNREKAVVSAAHKKSSRRLAHRSTAKKILKHFGILSPRKNRDGDYSIHRIRTCMDKRKYTVDNVIIRLSESPEQSRASLSGLVPCGCIWGCPFCAPKISTQRQAEISQVFDWASANGMVIFLLHLTARHDKSMSLRWFNERFKKAWAMFTSGGGWKQLRERYGIEHYIANVEPLHNDDNGWHYHKHVALCIPAATILDGEHYKVIEAALRERWLHCLGKSGLDGIGEYALKITVDGNLKEHYLTKLNINPDDVTRSGVHEVASSSTKTESTGRTVWQILEAAHTGDKEAAALYAEFVAAMSGDNWITASKGLWDLAGVNLLDEVQAAALDEPVQVDWYTLDEIQLSNMVYFQAHSQVTDVAAITRDKTAVTAYFDLLQSERDKRDFKPVLYRDKSIVALVDDRARLDGLINEFSPSGKPDHVKRVNYWRACRRDLMQEFERRELLTNPLFDYHRE